MVNIQNEIYNIWYSVIALFWFWYFWCKDERKAFHLGVFIFLSVFVNEIFLRFPIQISLSKEAQVTLSSAILLALWSGKKRAFAVAVLFIALTSFVLLYCGYPLEDLIAGWILGTVIIVLYWKFALCKNLPEIFFAKGGMRVQMICASLVGFGFNAIGNIHIGGVFLGFSAGYILMKNRFPFSSYINVKGKKRILILGGRFALGIAGLVALVWVFFDTALPILTDLPLAGENTRLITFIIYALLGLWVSTLSPLLFIRLKLAESSELDA